ncbi:hypothetical protein AV530_004434 [Patagioenas fasciata monilis]|uniref:Uncharacterized protein n=1 Tax=Patagioenas fasciata monilis TaxID=372326 RepID=A0A1V4K2X3_PATFA|nr:hypothetical protein AV530_004434 [Patagioenas fasciata monilis]
MGNGDRAESGRVLSTYVFRPAPPELRQRGAAQTGGIDLFVTQERVVLLDTQPILSPALLDHLINNDRKLPPEYGLPHSYVEMQVISAN